MSDTSPTVSAPPTNEPTTGAGPQIDTAVVRDLAQILKDTDLTTLEVEHGALRIRVAREVTVQAAPVHQLTAPQAAPATAPAASASPAPAAQQAAPTEASGETVKSPMVGTVYLQPQPGSASFVKVGDVVSEGQTLVLVEAMKTMNPIPAPRAGKIKALLVADAQPVEYGEPLVVLE